MTNNVNLAKANAAFRNGDYQTAAKSYQKLLSHGGIIEKIARSNLRLISAKTGKLIQPSLEEINHKNIKPLVESLKLSDGNLIITYPIIPWDFRIQRPQHLVARLSKQGFTSLYIANDAPPILPSTDDEILDCLGTRELAAGVHEIWLQTEQGYNIYKKEISGQNLVEMTHQLETVCRYLNPNRLIHLVQFPGWTPLAEKAKQVCGGSIVYDCMDHHAGFTNNTAEALSQEERLIRNADLVLASSQLLERELKPRAKEVILIKNATEYEHFKNPRPNGKLDHLKGPIIGYYGAISDWFDIDLVTESAKKRPDWNFVLIGSTHLCDTSRAEQFSNIHFFGEIPYRDLPGYFSYFDVCTIPFKIIPLTKATNPVKFYEYISAGKPIVATSLPELLPYSDFVYFASDAKSFVEKIEKAYQIKDDNYFQCSLKDFAINNDWDARVAVLLSHDVFMTTCYNKPIDRNISSEKYESLQAKIIEQAKYIEDKEIYIAQLIKTLADKPSEEQRSYLVTGELIVISAVPYDDVGGGQRGAQIARCALKTGRKVMYIYVYPKFDFDLNRHVDSDVNIFGLTHIAIDNISPVEMLNMVTSSATVLIEHPHPKIIPYVELAKIRGIKTVFELIDDWETSLGGDWFDINVYKYLVDKSDVVVGTAKVLVQRLNDLGRDDALYLPNAANEYIFDKYKSYARPIDLPSNGERTALYFGSLYGEWFSWEHVKAAAEFNINITTVR